MSEATKDKADAPKLTITYKSGSKIQKVNVEPKKEGNRYLLGVSPAIKTGFWDKVVGGFTATWTTTGRILTALKDLIFNFNLNKLGGPVAIYNVSSQAAQQGLPAILSLLAMLSLNIGIFNLIPIPALDGGKIVLNILEAIRRKPLKRETESYVTLAGVAVMVVLMIAVTWNDIMKLFF